MRARRNGRLRVLDRWVGIPLVAVLGAARRRRAELPHAPRSVAFLKVAAIGDTLLMSAAVQDARAAWPGAKISFFAGEDNVAAARLLPGVDEVIPIAAGRPLMAIRRMRQQPVDLLIDCGPWPRINAVLAALSGAAFTAGFRTPGQHRHFAYDRTAPHSNAVHEVDNYRTLMRAVGAETRHTPAIVAPATMPDDRVPVGPFAVVHMWSAGTGGWQKEWPTERWVEVARALGERGLHVLVSGGPGDVARSAAFVTTAALPHVRSVSGTFTLAEMAGVLARAALLISVNTGIMHLGAIAGAPTLSLDGPTPVHRWGPIGTRARSVTSRLPGCGYLHLGFEYAGRRSDCMMGIATADVIAAADALMNGS